MRQFLLVISLLAVVISCNKSDDTFEPVLPLITTTGENTFGCYVNGVLVTPRDGEGTFNSNDFALFYTGSPDPQNSYNEINVKDFKSGTGARLDLHISNLFENGEGEFVIGESNCENGINAIQNINIRCRLLDKVTQTYKWYCSIENSGSLVISRYDFDNRIVSGTFSCSAVNQDNPNEIIRITEGRFDLKWDELPKSFP